jgi:hypothetical protein
MRSIISVPDAGAAAGRDPVLLRALRGGLDFDFFAIGLLSNEKCAALSRAAWGPQAGRAGKHEK